MASDGGAGVWAKPEHEPSLRCGRWAYMSGFRQSDVSRAIAGALKGGLQWGAFSVEILPSGSIRILPATPGAPIGDSDLDDELRRWKHGQDT